MFKDEFEGDQDDEEQERKRKIESTKFVIKNKYNEYDLQDFYEHRRYFTPFIIYKWMDYWPIIDYFATYGHFVNNFIIVVISIYWNVSVFMFLNLCCVCIFYMVATFKL